MSAVGSPSGGAIPIIVFIATGTWRPLSLVLCTVLPTTPPRGCILFMCPTVLGHTELLRECRRRPGLVRVSQLKFMVPGSVKGFGVSHNGNRTLHLLEDSKPRGGQKWIKTLHGTAGCARFQLALNPSSTVRSVLLAVRSALPQAGLFAC